jgi:hypothetical protein
MVSQKPTDPGRRSDTLTIPELEQSKTAVLNTLASIHSRRCYAFAIDRFIAWYCSGELEQIRFLLGHASVQTTERYIGSKPKLQDAVNDRFEISVANPTA